MRRMIATKQINLIEELSKYLEIDNTYNRIEVDAGIKLNEDRQLFGSTSEDTVFTIGLDRQYWMIGPSDDSSDTSDCGIRFGQTQGKEIDFYASGLGKLISIQSSPDEEPGLYGNNSLEIGVDTSQDIGIYMENTTGLMSIYSTKMYLQASGGNIVLVDLPTADPHVVGALWNDNGTLKISAGA